MYTDPFSATDDYRTSCGDSSQALDKMHHGKIPSHAAFLLPTADGVIPFDAG